MKAHTDLIEYLDRLGVSDPAGKSKTMLAYMALVLEASEKINLTTITEPTEFIEKHLMDSACCYGWSEIRAAGRIADMGSGAGFPGVPLAILYPDKEFVLIDSLSKRVEFLRGALRVLGLDNVSAVKSRAEDAGRAMPLREAFDLCLCRAVGKLALISEYCLPLVRAGGFVYAWKTEGARGEIEDSLQARLLLGAAREVEVRACELYGGGAPGDGITCHPELVACHPELVSGSTSSTSTYAHNIMILRKERPTPDTYPRRAGVPARVPL